MEMTVRKLNIGGGAVSIPGFETYNLGDSKRTDGSAPDHVGDCRKLPFADGAFAVVHASHIIEHVQWDQIHDTIREWFRVVAVGGRLEVWAPDGYKLAKAIVEHEEKNAVIVPAKDLRWKWGECRKDVVNWCGARIMSYARTGDCDANIHRSILTPKLLMRCLTAAGAKDVRMLQDSERRDHNHGWINMGAVGFR